MITNGQMTKMEQLKQRNAEATAGKIVAAAKTVFHEKGFDAATTRQIAERADINVNLINRYFGSKLGLFKKAVLPHLSLRPFLEGERETLPDRLADFYSSPDEMEKFDAFVVLVRSITSDDAGPVLMAHLRKDSVAPLSAFLEGPDREARATLIASQLAGLVLRFRIMKQLPMEDDQRKALRNRLRTILAELIFEQ